MGSPVKPEFHAQLQASLSAKINEDDADEGLQFLSLSNWQQQTATEMSQIGSQ